MILHGDGLLSGQQVPMIFTSLTSSSNDSTAIHKQTTESKQPRTFSISMSQPGLERKRVLSEDCLGNGTLGLINLRLLGLMYVAKTGTDREMTASALNVLERYCFNCYFNWSVLLPQIYLPLQIHTLPLRCFFEIYCTRFRKSLRVQTVNYRIKDFASAQ